MHYRSLEALLLTEQDPIGSNDPAFLVLCDGVKQDDVPRFLGSCPTAKWLNYAVHTEEPLRSGTIFTKFSVFRVIRGGESTATYPEELD